MIQLVRVTSRSGAFHLKKVSMAFILSSRDYDFYRLNLTGQGEGRSPIYVFRGTVAMYVISLMTLPIIVLPARYRIWFFRYIPWPLELNGA